MASDVAGLIERFADAMERDGVDLPTALYAVQRALLIRFVRKCGGNQCRAAAALGMHRNTLQRQLGEIGKDVVRLNGRGRPRKAVQG